MFTHLVLLLFSTPIKRARALGLAGGLLCFIAASLAFGQAPSTGMPGSQSKRVSLPHLYWHFLIYQNHLDQVAAQRVANGKDGSWLSNHFEQKLGFTDAQFAVVRATAQRLAPELQAVDAQAMAFIAAYRAAHPHQPGSPPLSGPAPPEIAALMQQHEAVIQKEIANLQSVLGPELSARLENFLQTQFALNVTVQNIPPNPNDPKTDLLAVLKQKEAQK
jgi:hypothetical protein